MFIPRRTLVAATERAIAAAPGLTHAQQARLRQTALSTTGLTLSLNLRDGNPGCIAAQAGVYYPGAYTRRAPVGQFILEFDRRMIETCPAYRHRYPAAENIIPVR